MKKIHILVPDSLSAPFGGMGVQCKKIINILNDKYAFQGICANVNNNKYQSRNIDIKPVSSRFLNINPRNCFIESIIDQSTMIVDSLSFERPDLIHAFDFTSAIAGAKLSDYWKVPLITTFQLSHWMQTEDILKNAEFTDVQKMFYNIWLGTELSVIEKSSVVIQVSETYLKSYPKLFQHKMVVIGNGIDITEFTGSEDMAPLPGKNKFKLIYIGRFDYMKNIIELVNSKIPDEVDLIFIGGTRGGEPSLHNMAIELSRKKNNVFMMGELHGKQKTDALMQASAVIVPSLHEPFGIVALEALASRSVLLSSFVGGMKDYLTEDCAINCGTNRKTIEESIKKALNIDFKTKEKMADKGIEVCKKYSWEIQANKLEKIYNNF